MTLENELVVIATRGVVDVPKPVAPSLQRLAIELFRRQTSRSSSPPDQRPGVGHQPSEKEPRPGKTIAEDSFQPPVSADAAAKEREEDEKTQQDDSNVSHPNPWSCF